MTSANFLDFYLKNADRVFADFLEATPEREDALILTERYFAEIWQEIRRQEKIQQFKVGNMAPSTQ